MRWSTTVGERCSLVLQCEPADDAWPDDPPALPDDARAWLGWRRPSEEYLCGSTCRWKCTLALAE